jgi:hypothetical protein
MLPLRSYPNRACFPQQGDVGIRYRASDTGQDYTYSAAPTSDYVEILPPETPNNPRVFQGKKKSTTA